MIWTVGVVELFRWWRQRKALASQATRLVMECELYLAQVANGLPPTAPPPAGDPGSGPPASGPTPGSTPGSTSRRRRTDRPRPT